ANSLAFGLRELAKDPESQEKLRMEIHSYVGGSKSSIAYDNLPLLNACIEVRRKIISKRYEYILLSRSQSRSLWKTRFLPSIYGITTSSGEKIMTLPIRKGQLVTMALGSYQRSLESVWGPDAHEFKLMRWLKGALYSEDAAHIGPYSSLCVYS
ncbi:hypothetical protein DFH09DRAFT_1498345, partial [Mycena vulgaris]